MTAPFRLIVETGQDFTVGREGSAGFALSVDGEALSHGATLDKVAAGALLRRVAAMLDPDGARALGGKP